MPCHVIFSKIFAKDLPILDHVHESLPGLLCTLRCEVECFHQFPQHGSRQNVADPGFFVTTCGSVVMAFKPADPIPGSK